MGTERRFCRFTNSAAGNEFGLQWDDPDGLCLSAFVILTQEGRPSSVLLGRMNPRAPWDHLGGLDPERVRVHAGGWVLPASQLILRESPDAAAWRILEEMLGGIEPKLDPPRVVSEVYAPRRFPEAKNHWDLLFLFRGRWDGPAPHLPAVWNSLKFVDVSRTGRSAFARSHDEVLESAGFTLAAS